MFRAAVIALVMLLAGCATDPRSGLTDEEFVHRMPTPYKACTAKPLVIIHEDNVYVGFTYEDSLRQAICEENKITYIEQLLAILCTYTKDCEPKENDDAKN